MKLTTTSNRGYGKRGTMSEIDKLFKNANVDKDCELYPNYFACPDKTKECTYCEHYVYPEFTAEKQIELIKWLAFRDYITIVAYMNGEYHSEHDKYNANENSLEGCLARLINNLWQDLTDTEKAEIKRILE